MGNKNHLQNEIEGTPIMHLNHVHLDGRQVGDYFVDRKSFIF
jgi:hypothetical protein